MAKTPLESKLEEIIGGQRATFDDWDLDRIKAAESYANAGSLLLAADLCDQLRADPKIAGALETRTGALAGLPITFEASAQGRKRKAAVRALEADEDWFDAFPEDQLRELSSWAILLGLALGQLVWVAKDDRVIPTLKVWHPRNIRFDIWTSKWVLRCIKGGSQTEIPITPGDGEWILLTPKGGAQPWLHGVWRGVAKWWLLKQYAQGDWARYSSVKGQGIWVGTTSAPVKQEDRTALARDLNAMGTDAAIALPYGYDLKLLESVANTSATFEAQTRVADEQFIFSIHGTNMSSEAGGSNAKAVVLDGVRLQLIASDAESLSTCIHDDALSYWAEFNFGSGDLAPWPHWQVEPPADVKAAADSYLAIANGLAALVALDDRVDVESLLEEANIPMLAKPKVAPEPAPPPPVPPQPVEQPPTPEGEHAPSPEPVVAKALTRVKANKLAPHVKGMVYADAVGDAGRDAAKRAVASNVRDLSELIAGAESYEALRAGLLDLYRGLDPTEMAEVVERALILSQLGGMLSAQRSKK